MTVKFSFEVPIKHLHDFHPYQDFHFALSFLYERYPEYGLYHHSCVSAGEILIIDNSFNELKKAESLSRLISLMKEYKADAIVCPDSDEWTVKEQYASYDNAVQHCGVNRVWAVARWPEEVATLRRKATVLAIPYEYRMFLDLTTVTARMHFLGLNNPAEVINLRPVSVDTSMPVKLAIAGLSMRDWVMEGCPHFHTHEMRGFFDIKLSPELLKQSIENIKHLKEVVNERNFTVFRP